VRIHPRQNILDVWRSVVKASFQSDAWVWDGRDESNPISDAEQLLCLLYPATEIPSLCLDRPDIMATDVLKTLQPLGYGVQIPTAIIRILADYMAKYTDKQGEPIFAGGSYFWNSSHKNGNSSEQSELTGEQRALDIVDAYSMSVTLCLAALGFIRIFKLTIATGRRIELKANVEELERAVSSRLTAAMVGLLRSFVVKTVRVGDEPGRVMLSMVNQSGAPESVLLENLRRSLATVRAVLRDDVRIGIAPEVEIDNEDLLFECGWTWSIAHNAAPVGFVEMEIAKRVGIANSRPYLYFTVLALDGLNDLFSPRTRELGLLDEQQRRLSDALSIRWEVTQRYWSTIARFGNQQKWPLEDIPWRTSDGEESEYYSLQVSSVLVQDLNNRQATDDDLNRAVGVFEELARRGRITCRPMKKVDPAITLHVPGVSLTLKEGPGEGTESGLYWSVADFAPLLLKRSLMAARLAATVSARDRLMRIAEETMEHLSRRRLTVGMAAGLWDAPAKVFLPPEDRLSDGNNLKQSWYMTSRVIEGLVIAVKTFEKPPPRNPNTIAGALDLINEAEHLLNQEMLRAEADDKSAMHTALNQIEARLVRARWILNERPGTAHALILKALGELDELAFAQQDATRST
jgi:hypothetical protein